MKVLALEKEVPGVGESAFTETLLRREALRAWELQQSGEFREMYFRPGEDLAVIVLECPDVPEARRILSTLPLVGAGLIDFDIFALSPYPGFSRLFTHRQDAS